MEGKSLKDEIREMREEMKDTLDKQQKKKFRLPLRAKIGKSKIKKGYVIVQILDQNRNITFEKLPLIDGTYKIGDTYHAIKDKDIFYYKGKPFVIQPKKKKNPYNPLYGKNQTYGQKYIVARMIGDQIKEKKAKLSGGIIIALIIAAIVAIYFISQGGLG